MRTRGPACRQAGFTLLEIIIVLGMGAVIGIILMQIMVNNSGFFYKQNAIISEGLNLNDAVRKIEETVKQAAFVSVGYPEVSPIFTSNSSTLVLKLPALDNNGAINNVYDFVVVAKDPNNAKILRMKVFPDAQSIRKSADLVLTTLLDSIQFSYLDKSGNTVAPTAAKVVGMTLGVLAKTGSIGSNRSSTIMVTLRNN